MGSVGLLFVALSFACWLFGSYTVLRWRLCLPSLLQRLLVTATLL